MKLLWSPTLVRKLCNHVACSICNRGCCNFSLLGLEIDDSGHSKSSSPPPSKKIATRGWSAAYLLKGMRPFYHLKCPPLPPILIRYSALKTSLIFSC